MKNWPEGKIVLARDRALTRMKATGLTAVYKVVDNEASALYKKAIKDSGMTYERVSPDNHWRNLAERAFQNWKAHFIAILSGTAKEFPMHIWDLVLP